MNDAVDLFSFDFSEDVTEESIQEKFKEVQRISKEKLNCYFIGLHEISNMLRYVDEFEKRGWIERKGSNGFLIPDKYVDFHTPDEVIDNFKECINQVMQKENLAWYEDVLPVINFASSPIRLKNEEEKKEINKRKKEVIKKTALKMGLQHFINVPKARGHKMYNFNSKWERENLLPLIAKYVIPIQDYDDMEQFFRTQYFFTGRMDWKTNMSAPYPDFNRFSPSFLEIASLCEATEQSTVQLILDYSGNVTGGKPEEPSYILYPENWSWERYENSLTDEDIQKIEDDKERLKRLHNK